MSNVPWAHLRLPPFPQVAIRVLQLVNRETIQLHQLSELIASDPAFAGEILTIANSALYAPRFPTKSILQAIAVLGANNLQGICLTVGTRAYLGKAFNQPSMRLVWRHNLASALIGAQLASAGFLDKDTAYTAGVIHDISPPWEITDWPGWSCTSSTGIVVPRTRCATPALSASEKSGSPSSMCSAMRCLSGSMYRAILNTADGSIPARASWCGEPGHSRDVAAPTRGRHD